MVYNRINLNKHGDCHINLISNGAFKSVSLRFYEAPFFVLSFLIITYFVNGDKLGIIIQNILYLQEDYTDD